MPRLTRLMLHWLGFADHPEPWSGPQGDYFISDKDKTCQYLRQRFLPQEVEVLSRVLGLTLVARIKGHLYLISENYVEDIEEKIVRRGKDFLISRAYSAVWERIQAAKILRDESDLGYWVASNGPLRGYREFFRSITDEEFQALTAHLPRDADGLLIATPPDEATLKAARRVPRYL